MRSAAYIGFVDHGRSVPIEHHFRYRLFMIYLDLDELPFVFSGTPFWSVKHPSLAWFRRADYHGNPVQSLAKAVHETVHQHTGIHSMGPIRMLTHLRYFGHCFNPVTFYYCFDPSGRQLEAVMAEVTNTPWHERHCYVATNDAGNGQIRERMVKSFHVSPFMGMDVGYIMSFNTPSSAIHIEMTTIENDIRVFQANLSLQRRAITPGLLNRLLVIYPFMTLRVVAAIYWQALLLKVKGAPFYVHPAKRKATLPTHE